MGGKPIRRTAVPNLLQDLHGKGVGSELQRDFRRLGRAANQRTFAEFGDQEWAFTKIYRRGPLSCGENANRYVSLFPARPWNDVGNVCREGPRNGRRGKD